MTAQDEARDVPGTAAERVVVPRWIQMVVLPLALLGLWALARAAGPVLLLFIVAGLIALLLNPFVSLLTRLRVPRGLAVLVMALLVIVFVGGVVALLANPIADQVAALQRSVPGYLDDANRSLAQLQTWLNDHGVDVHFADQGRTALQGFADRLTAGSGTLVRFTRDALTTLVEASFAVVLIVVLTIYMLLYGERIGALVRAAIPSGDGSREDDFPTQIQRAVYGYVRGQLLFSAIMGASAGAMLWVLGTAGVFPEGRSYALFFGVFYGIAELIPYVGPVIGAAPPVLVALLGSHAIDAVWLVVGFIALQQIEGHVVAPNVFGQALRINPLLVIFALLMGAQLYGLVGAFVALPTAAMLRETVIYFRRHLVLEPWPRMVPGLAGVGTGVADPGGGGPAACDECGEPMPPTAASCPACGTEAAARASRTAAGSAAPG